MGRSTGERRARAEGSLTMCSRGQGRAGLAAQGIPGAEGPGRVGLSRVTQLLGVRASPALEVRELRAPLF